MLSEFSPRRTSRLSRVHIVRFAKFGAAATAEGNRPVAAVGVALRNAFRSFALRAGVVSGGRLVATAGPLASALPLQVLDCGPHLVRVPRRPVVALWQSCQAGAPPCRDDADRQAFGPVLLAERQELRRQRDRRQLAPAGSSFSAHAVVCAAYQPTLARPRSPLLVPPSIRLSRRCASTPSWNVSLSFSSAPSV